MTNKPVDFDEYTENYDDLLKQATRFFVSDEAYFAEYKVDIFRREVSNVQSLLEFGCGIGRNLPYLASAFPSCRVVGSDISPVSLKMASELNPDIEFHLEPKDAEKDDLFDAIFIAGVFHHIAVDQRGDVLADLRSRLKPNGSLFIFEHNPFNPVTRRIVNNCPYDEDAVLLTPGHLKKLVSKAGFRVLRHRYCLFFPPNFAALSTLERYLGLLPLGGQYWLKATRGK